MEDPEHACLPGSSSVSSFFAADGYEHESGGTGGRTTNRGEAIGRSSPRTPHTVASPIYA